MTATGNGQLCSINSGILCKLAARGALCLMCIHCALESCGGGGERGGIEGTNGEETVVEMCVCGLGFGDGV